MVFLASAGHVIIDKKTNKTLFKFDKNGEYETADENIIKKLINAGFETKKEIKKKVNK